MIKKFKEYNEDKSELVECLSDIIPIVEVEDQFLRLKEVFDCKITIMDVIANIKNIIYIKRYSVAIEYPMEGIRTVKNGPEILKELNQIKYRLMSISNKIDVNMDDLNNINISLKNEFDYWQSL